MLNNFFFFTSFYKRVWLLAVCQSLSTTSCQISFGFLFLSKLAPHTNSWTDNTCMQDTKSTQTKQLKTMKPHLPHLCSLDVLPSPTNKWGTTTHPVKIGFLVTLATTYPTSIYYHQGCVLHTNAFAPSTTATTIGGQGKPKGSTKLNAMTGCNCAMTEDNKYTIFFILVLGLWQGKLDGTKQSERSFLNMLLNEYVSISDLTTVFALNKPTDQCALAHILTRFSLLPLGATALTPTITGKVWGQNKWSVAT
jgi:hypothetical protein